MTDYASQFLVAEHGSIQKEKVSEDYNDAYPLTEVSLFVLYCFCISVN